MKNQISEKLVYKKEILKKVIGGQNTLCTENQ